MFKLASNQIVSYLQSDMVICKNYDLELLKRIEPNYYKGKTGDNSCESTLRGASYARSEVEIFEDKIISWDRGFDAQSNYVWGAEKGGYVFNKLD